MRGYSVVDLFVWLLECVADCSSWLLVDLLVFVVLGVFLVLLNFVCCYTGFELCLGF